MPTWYLQYEPLCFLSLLFIYPRKENSPLRCQDGGHKRTPFILNDKFRSLKIATYREFGKHVYLSSRKIFKFKDFKVSWSISDSNFDIPESLYQNACEIWQCLQRCISQSNIYDGAFCENDCRLKDLNYFRKKLYLRYFTGFYIHL